MGDGSVHSHSISCYMVVSIQLPLLDDCEQVIMFSYRLLQTRHDDDRLLAPVSDILGPCFGCRVMFDIASSACPCGETISVHISTSSKISRLPTRIP